MSKTREFAFLFASLYLPTFVMSCGQGMVAPMIPTLSTQFGVTDGVAAQIITASSIGRISSLAPSGLAVDRFGTRPGMIAGAALVVAGTLGAMFAPIFPLLLLAQALVGAGNSTWNQGREIAAINMVSPSQRGRMISSMFGVNTAGMALGPTLSGFLTDHFGYRASFGVFLGFSLMVLVVTFFSRPDLRRRPARRRSEGGSGSRANPISLIPAFYRVSFLILLASTCTAQIRNAAMNTLLPIYGEVERGLSSTEVGALFGIIGVANLAMIGPVGFLSDRFGRKAAIVPSIVLAAIALVLYPFAQSFWPMAVVTTIMGIGSGLALGSMTISTYDIAPEQHRGVLQSLRRGVGETGNLIGPVISGAIIDRLSPGAAFHVFTPLFVVMAFLAIFVLRETHPSRQPRSAARAD